MTLTALERIHADPVAGPILDLLLDAVGALGPFDVEEKQASLHITHGRAFLGVHPRAGGLLLNIVTTGPLLNDRIRKSEQISKSRCHNEVLVTDASHIDADLRGWLREAYALTAPA
jgi:hypothetical protein